MVFVFADDHASLPEMPAYERQLPMEGLADNLPEDYGSQPSVAWLIFSTVQLQYGCKTCNLVTIHIGEIC